MGLRYYDLRQGRWTQQDLLQGIGDPNNANRYGAFGDDPLNTTDPTGAVYQSISGCLALIGGACGSLNFNEGGAVTVGVQPATGLGAGTSIYPGGISGRAEGPAPAGAEVCAVACGYGSADGGLNGGIGVGYPFKAGVFETERGYYFELFDLMSPMIERLIVGLIMSLVGVIVISLSTGLGRAIEHFYGQELSRRVGAGPSQNGRYRTTISTGVFFLLCGILLVVSAFTRSAS